MKKLILLSAFIFIAVLANGQAFEKGNLISPHVVSVTLAPGITIDKFMDYFSTKLIPEIEKATGWKTYLVKGIRGENPDSFGLIYIIKSEKDRDKFFNADGTFSELGKQLGIKMKPFEDELNKLGTYTTKYTDWLVL